MTQRSYEIKIMVLRGMGELEISRRVAVMEFKDSSKSQEITKIFTIPLFINPYQILTVHWISSTIVVT